MIVYITNNVNVGLSRNEFMEIYTDLCCTSSIRIQEFQDSCWNSVSNFRTIPHVYAKKMADVISTRCPPWSPGMWSQDACKLVFFHVMNGDRFLSKMLPGTFPQFRLLRRRLSWGSRRHLPRNLTVMGTGPQEIREICGNGPSKKGTLMPKTYISYISYIYHTVNVFWGGVFLFSRYTKKYHDSPEINSPPVTTCQDCWRSQNLLDLLERLFSLCWALGSSNKWVKHG